MPAISSGERVAAGKAADAVFYAAPQPVPEGTACLRSSLVLHGPSTVQDRLCRWNGSSKAVILPIF